jgi:NifU-like protein involved in Fe-S cluster formation
MMEEKRTILLQNMGYSPKAIALILSQVNLGELENPTVSFKQEGICSDILFLYLKIDNRLIVDASFKYIGCLGLQVCGFALTQMIKGMMLQDALRINARHILQFIGRIPRNKHDCAQIASSALQNAIKKYLSELSE